LIRGCRGIGAFASRSTSTSTSKAFAPLRGTSHFLLLVQEKVTKEKDTPVSRRAGGAGAVPCAARQYRAGPNSHIHVLKHAGLSPGPGSAARREPNGGPKSQQQRQQQRQQQQRQQERAVASLGYRRAKRCRWAMSEAGETSSKIEACSGSSAVQSPFFPPSSAGIRRGKARMSEAMDGRVRAGRRIPSNAGHGARSLRDTGNPGCPSLWLLSLGQARESDSLPEGQ